VDCISASPIAGPGGQLARKVNFSSMTLYQLQRGKRFALTKEQKKARSCVETDLKTSTQDDKTRSKQYLRPQVSGIFALGIA
jgi:hypothetical protein